MFFSKKDKEIEVVHGNPSRSFPSNYELRKKVFINAYSRGYYSDIKNFELIQIDENYKVRYVEKIKFLAFIYDHPRQSVSVDSTHFYYINDQDNYIYSELIGNSFKSYTFKSQKGWLAHLFLSGIENEVIDKLNKYLKTNYQYDDELIKDQDFIDRISLPLKEFVNIPSVKSELKLHFGRSNIGEALLAGYEMEIINLLDNNERYSASISWNLIVFFND